ncbi:GntR family transcriptional regulator [Rhizobium laguerreae]|uniref:GntR family transcriptional regulator n=1 Tax=Rhizobium laguerreae TaxID=1076926 RepID=UPI001C920212|nr:GntR family transcriptional regulator [Rhizobium laguerreae]MBY3381833.1 GntR family transcriptional regulator [Rhizobium laguerreae]
MSRLPIKTKGNKGPRGSNVSATYEKLRHEIISMQLKPGEVLDEAALSKRFNLSRSPVREAMVRLASEGLVTVLTNRSTVVSSLDLQSLPSYFDALELIQRAVTRLAAINWRPHHLAIIKKHEAAFADALHDRDLAGMLSANYEYHMAIAEAAGNKYFKIIYARILDEGKRLLHSNYNIESGASGPSQLVQEHSQITAAIENRDADQAEKCGYDHAVMFRKRILLSLSLSELPMLKLG